jgi:hypothetical protein
MKEYNERQSQVLSKCTSSLVKRFLTFKTIILSIVNELCKNKRDSLNVKKSTIWIGNG